VGEGFIQDAQDNVTLIALMLIGFSFVFILADRLRGEREIESASWRDAIAIGCAQAFALIPGTSRSGATISIGMMMGFDRKAAARFSFLLSAPVITAALLLTLPDLAEAGSQDMNFVIATAVGFVAAAISGYIAVAALLKFLGGHALGWFAVYRIPAGLFFLWYFA
jgi:undecaprenyl-diphosphatase